MSGLAVWFEHAHPERRPLSTACLRRRLETGTQLQLVSGRRVREETEITAKVLTVRLLQTHEFACSDSSRDDDTLVWLPFARAGQHANRVAWYVTPDGLELESPHALLRYRMEASAASISNEPQGEAMNNPTANLKSMLESASPEALAVLLDASYNEDATLCLETTDDETLDAELEALLIACGAKRNDDAEWVFADAEMPQFMALVQTLAPDDAMDLEPNASNTASSVTAAETEYIVFNGTAFNAPASLPDEAEEALELETKGYTLRRIPVDEIRIEPVNNPRTRTARAGVIRLARSIAKRGLLQPVTVRPIAAGETNDGPGFELVFGYRRLAAIRHAIQTDLLEPAWGVPCVVRKLNDSQVRLAALTENEDREEVDLLDQAEGWARLRLTQTAPGIADAAGVTLRDVRRCLKVAFAVCDEVKAAYREGKLEWSALIAFSYGSLEAQRTHLASATPATWKLHAEHVRQAMRSQEFKFANARFTLEEYGAAGGVLETDLWHSNDGTRLLSSEVIERLQTAWAEAQVEEFKARGLAFVEVRHGPWNWWSEFSRAGANPEGAAVGVGAVVHMRSDWAVDMIEGLVPHAGHAQVNSGNPPSITGVVGQAQAGNSGVNATPEKAKLEHSEAGITLARRLRTAALQQVILEHTDPKLPLALAVLGFLGEREVRFSIKPLGESDAIASKVILAELESFASRLPRLSFNPSHGLELSTMTRFEPNARLDVLAALLNLPRTQLDRLHRLLVATMLGDWVSVSDGGPERKRSLKVNAFTAGLAAHLGVRGAEAFELSEVFLKTIGFRKARLEPYLAATVGEGVARALMDNPRAKIIAEILAQQDKLTGEFVPPELDFAAHAPQGVVQLTAHEEPEDDFARDGHALEPEEAAVDLIAEDELGLDRPHVSPLNEGHASTPDVDQAAD